MSLCRHWGNKLLPRRSGQVIWRKTPASSDHNGDSASFAYFEGDRLELPARVDDAGVMDESNVNCDVASGRLASVK